MTTRAPDGQGSLGWRRLNTPQVWAIELWLLLIFYPLVSREIFKRFDCIEYDRGSDNEIRYLLREEPALNAGEATT